MVNNSNELRLIHHDRSTVLYKAFIALGMAICMCTAKIGALAEFVIIVLRKITISFHNHQTLQSLHRNTFLSQPYCHERLALCQYAPASLADNLFAYYLHAQRSALLALVCPAKFILLAL